MGIPTFTLCMTRSDNLHSFARYRERIIRESNYERIQWPQWDRVYGAEWHASQSYRDLQQLGVAEAN